MASFLAAEHLIAERLAALLPDDVHVLTAADLDGAAQGSHPTPAVFVVYDGYTAGDSTPTGSQQKLAQRWVVISAARHVGQARSGQAARQEAGQLVGQVIGALQGHRLSPDHSILQMANAPRPIYRHGLAYLFTAWDTTIVTKPTGA